MVQLVPIPVKHLKVGDRVFNTIVRTCETIKEIDYDGNYYTIKYELYGRVDELKSETSVQVLIDVHHDL